jgi:hypothetical protein
MVITPTTLQCWSQIGSQNSPGKRERNDNHTNNTTMLIPNRFTKQSWEKRKECKSHEDHHDDWGEEKNHEVISIFAQVEFQKQMLNTPGNLLTHIILLCSLNVEKNSCYDWEDQNMPLGKDGGLQFVSESLLQKLMQVEEYANSTSEGCIYHTELCFNAND